MKKTNFSPLNNISKHSRQIAVIIALCTSLSGFGQCSLSVSLSGSSTPCVGHDTLTVRGASTATQILWVNNGTTVATYTQSGANYGITVAGDSAGNFGSSDSLLNAPLGIWVDVGGNLFVSDKANNRVLKFASGSRQGLTVAGSPVGTAGTTSDLLSGPTGLFVDTAGNLYVADENNNRVQKWAPGASHGVTVAGDSAGSAGTAANRLSEPIGLWVDHTGNVYVSDQNNNRVQKWAPGASTGTTVAGNAFGTSGTGASMLNTPAGICMDNAGNLYIADATNNRVQRWAHGASSGVTVAGSASGIYSYFEPFLFFPFGVYFDNTSGLLYVADAGNNRVQVWVPGDTTGHTFAGDSLASFGVAPNRFNFPAAVFFSGHTAYVTDLGNNRIQRFGNSIDTTYVPTTAGNYTAIVTAGGCTDTTNIVIVDTAGAPSVSISGADSVCGSASVTFTATVTNGGTAPAFAWYRNGLPAGNNSSTYTDSLFSTGETVYVVVTGNAPCLTSPATSNTIHMTATAFSTFTANINATAVVYPCTGSLTDTFTASLSNGGSSPAYQWFRNGSPASTASVYSSGAISAGDSIWLVATSSSACVVAPVVSSNVIHIAAPTFYAPAAAGTAQITALACSLPAADTFTVVPVHGGASPSYSWFLNGSLAGSSASFGITAHLGDSVYVVMNSSDPCASPATATSNVIHITGTSTPDTPMVSVSANPGTSICTGSSVTFSSSVAHGGTSPSYQWYLDGTVVSTSASFYTNILQNGDSVRLMVTSNAPCIAYPGASSPDLIMTVSSTLAPSVTIASANGDTVCNNTPVNLFATATNGGTSPGFQWKLNGVNVGNSPTYVANAFHSGDTFTCVMTSNAACVSPNSAVSNPLSITLAPDPSPAISLNGSGIICPGDSVRLQASGGQSYSWSNGNNGQTIYVSSPGFYTVTATSPYGCTAGSAPVAITRAPALNDSIVIRGDTLETCAAAFYQWYYNGSIIGNATGRYYLYGPSGQYHVMVIDSNGCRYNSNIVAFESNGVKTIGAAGSLSLYPNPNTGSFFVVFADQEEHNIWVSDIDGRRLTDSWTASGQAQVSLGNALPSGLYLLHVSNAEGGQLLKFSLTR